MKIKYNSPVVLTFVFLCAFILLLNQTLFHNLIQLWFTAPSKTNFSSSDPRDWIDLVTHALGHASWNHLTGNLLIILIVGPMLEDIYGSVSLLVMMFITAFVTGGINALFFSTGLLGASGIVFMMILLASFTNFRKGEIPLTFILVLIFYVGNEVISSFKNDGIAHFVHIIGGFCGSVFGFFKKTTDNRIERSGVAGKQANSGQ
ncbi:MAG: rhomboid family intramembrane serine protease [Spirochaetaceae bacterium]|jgi:membrane associated rhomboid family serine protease|nr:rhomboid family intramembrane serine protease [Spirochaetaceae bacterium]